MPEYSPEIQALLKGRDSLCAYYVAQRPNYELARHQRVILEHCEALERGEFSNLMILSPPQVGKSTTATTTFPAWYFGRHPDHHLFLSAYSQELTNDFAAQVRDLVQTDYHRAIFPEFQLDEKMSALHDFRTLAFNGVSGACRSAGRGGSITGRSANCLPGETLVATTRGPMRIDALVTSTHPPKVLSYNHERECLEYRPIVASRVAFADELTEIETAGGRRLRATGEHRIFDRESGYRAAALLRPGDGLVACETGLRALRRPHLEDRDRLPHLFRPEAAPDEHPAQLRALSPGVRAAAFRIRERATAGAARLFLWGGLQPRLQKDCPEMRHLRQPHLAQDAKVLRALPAAQRLSTKIITETLRELWDYVSAYQLASAVLFAGLCERGAFAPDAGSGQLAFQGWPQLRQMVRRDASPDSGTGLELLRNLWGGRKRGAGQGLADPPYRRESGQQSGGELDHALLDLPHAASQIAGDAVSRTRRVRPGRLPVYDLQVAGNGNFFANEILLHNCYIIDDPLKDKREAQSEAVQRDVRQWFNTVVMTRRAPNAKVMIINTRWDQLDLAGWELAEHGDQWKVVELPALGVWQADGTRVANELDGEPLWPERYSRAWLEDMRARLPRDDWLALYQCKPSRDGDDRIFAEEWFQLFTPRSNNEDIRQMFVEIIVDPAKGKKKRHDYTVMWAVGLAPDRKFYFIDGLRARLGQRERWDALKALHQKWNASCRRLRVWYEEFGLMSDIEYFNERMKEEGYRFHIERIGSTRIGKDDWIKDFGTGVCKDRRVYFNEHIWTMTDGRKVNMTKDFFEQEWIRYPAVAHDDMLNGAAYVTDARIAQAFPNPARNASTEELYKRLKDRRKGIGPMGM